MKVRVRVEDCDRVGTIIHEGEYESVHTTSEGRSCGATLRWLAQLSDNRILVSVTGVGALVEERNNGTLWICSSPSDLSYLPLGDISVVWTKEQEAQETQGEQTAPVCTEGECEQ